MVTPVLKLPNINEQFILQIDASDIGTGAVLQYENGIKKPVAYANKKLASSQTKYSTVEKEYFAIIWAVQKFQRYLFGKEFFFETDYQPLFFGFFFLSQSKLSNARLMRWTLLLQPFRIASWQLRVLKMLVLNVLVAYDSALNLRRYFSFVNSFDLYLLIVVLRKCVKLS